MREFCVLSSRSKTWQGKNLATNHSHFHVDSTSLPTAIHSFDVTVSVAESVVKQKVSELSNRFRRRPYISSNQWEFHKEAGSTTTWLNTPDRIHYTAYTDTQLLMHVYRRLLLHAWDNRVFEHLCKSSEEILRNSTPSQKSSFSRSREAIRLRLSSYRLLSLDTLFGNENFNCDLHD